MLLTNIDVFFEPHSLSYVVIKGEIGGLKMTNYLNPLK